MKINHIGIETSDLFGMEIFYRKYFGLKPLYRYSSLNQPGLRTLILTGKGLALELLERPENAANSHSFHISLQSGDVFKDYMKLKKLGLDIKEPRITGDGFLEAAAADPEGNIIEISRRKKPAPVYPVKAVIFDLDGTLIDSEGNYYEADRRLMKSYGIALTPAMKHKYVGTGNLEMLRDLKKKHNIDDPIESMLTKKNNLYIEIASAGTKVYPEMIKFIEMLKRSGFPIAIASGSSPGVLEKIVSLTGLGKYFNIIVSAESVMRGKPFPDVFLEASRRLGADPLTCLVVEDAAAGVEAAGRAFMPCIAIPFQTDLPLPDSFLAADLLFKKGINSFRAGAAYKWVMKRHGV